MLPGRSGSERGRWVALVGLAAVGVFLVPWWLPAGGLVVSESATLGFGNRAAIAATLVAVLLGWWLAGRSRGSAAGLDWLDGREATAGEPTVGRRTVWLVVIGYLLVVGAYHFLLVAGSDFAESGYFLRRVRAVLAGARPWSGVELAYGPLLLLPELLLAAGGIGLRNAYDLVFLGYSLAGLWLFAVLLRDSAAPLRARQVVFCLVAAACLDLGTGLNYTLTRFLAPVILLLIGVPWLAGSVAARRPWTWVAVAAAVAVATATLGAALSPEIGVAAAVATLAAIVGCAWPRPSRVLFGVAGWSLAIAAVGAVLPLAYLRTFAAFAAGAHQLPVWPTPHALLYLGALLFTVPWMLAAGWPAATDPPHPMSARRLALGA